MVPYLIVLAGLPGSGKTTASGILSEKDFAVVSMGFLTKKILSECELPLNGENEEFVRRILRKKYGKDIYAKIAKAEIIKYMDSGENVVLEGLRSIEELEYINKAFPDLKLIYITAPKELRYKRLRERKIRSIARVEAEKRDREEINILGINKVRERADIILVNDISKKMFRSQIISIVNR